MGKIRNNEIEHFKKFLACCKCLLTGSCHFRAFGCSGGGGVVGRRLKKLPRKVFKNMDSGISLLGSIPCSTISAV